MIPAKLDAILFDSYKRFSNDEKIEIRPVTILVGKNSSGKSSITKLLPTLAKSFSNELKKSIMLLETDGVSLGVSYQSLCHNGNSTGLALGVEYKNGIHIKADLIASPKDEIQIYKYTVRKEGQVHTLKQAADRTNYICEETGKPYPVSGFSGFIHKDFFKDLEIETEPLSFNVDYIGPLRSEPQRNYYYLSLIHI